MSLLLDGVDDYATRANAPRDVVPLTVAAWAKPDVDARLQIASINSGAETNRFSIEASGTTAGDPVRAQSVAAGTVRNAVTTTALSWAGVWQHACGVFASSTSRSAFLNGAGKGSNVQTSTPAGLNALWLGRQPDGGAPFDGRLGHVAVWNIALSDADVAALAAGDNPLTIQPANLIRYWPLEDDAVCVITGEVLTLSGATFDAADNPPVDPPAGGGPQVAVTDTAGAGEQVVGVRGSSSSSSDTAAAGELAATARGSSTSSADQAGAAAELQFRRGGLVATTDTAGAGEALEGDGDIPVVGPQVAVTDTAGAGETVNGVPARWSTPIDTAGAGDASAGRRGGQGALTDGAGGQAAVAWGTGRTGSSSDGGAGGATVAWVTARNGSSSDTAGAGEALEATTATIPNEPGHRDRGPAGHRTDAGIGRRTLARPGHRAY